MAQPFYARKTDLKIGPRKGETVYSVQPYYYGTIGTKQVATQIAQESALTQADVIGVIERLAYFCQTHMALGYRIELEGMGTFFNAFITTGSVKTPEEVSAKLIKSIRPAFHAEYTIINKSFRYALMPEKTEVTRVNFKGVQASDDTSDGTTDSGNDGDTDENPLG